LIPRSGTAVTSDPSAAVSGTAYGNISVVEWLSSSGNALKSQWGVGSTVDYHIGVASANADDGSTWKYLKLDGVDPIGTATGAKAAAPFTDNLRNGLYPFSMVFYTVVTQAAAKKKSTDTLAKMADELTTTLKVPTVNLNGIAALPENAAAALSTMKGILSRAGNNNCAPLKVTTN
jgi:ABC-type phosphate transport system substrate-binding protein